MSGLKTFLWLVWTDWVSRMTGIASLILWGVGAFLQHEGGWSPPLIFWVAGAICLVVCCFRIWQVEHLARKAALDRLKPKLSIHSVAEKNGDRWRIKVWNLSGTTVRFSARLESADPPTGYQGQPALQITGAPPPYRELDIPGGRPAWVDVFTESHPGTPSIGLLSAADPPRSVPIQRRNYDIIICVFPVPPHEGAPAYRKFYVRPQPDGTLVLSDAEVPGRLPDDPAR